MCMIKEVKEELFYSQRTMSKKCMSLSMKMEISIRMLAHESMKKKFLRQRNGRNFVFYNYSYVHYGLF